MGIHGRMAPYQIRTSGTFMKFKEWLDIQENQATRQTPGDRSSAPPASRFGSVFTQLPISRSLDNAAVASVAGGLGNAMSRNFDKAGLKLSTTARIEELPRDGKPVVRHLSLPLQLPIVDNAPQLGPNFRYSKSSLKTMQNLIPNALSDSRIRRVGENGSAPGRFELYNSQNSNQNDPQRSLYAATEFTQALMHLILFTYMASRKDAPAYDLVNIKMESSRRDDRYNVLTCVFSIKINKLFQQNSSNVGGDQ